MLKVYKIKPYVSIDGAPWRRVSCQYYTVANIELTDELILDNISFQECRKYLSENHLKGIHNTEVHCWFKQTKPAMYIDYIDAWDKVVYTHFNTLSYKTEAEEWTDVTLDWIIKKPVCRRVYSVPQGTWHDCLPYYEVKESEKNDG